MNIDEATNYARRSLLKLGNRHCGTNETSTLARHSQGFVRRWINQEIPG
jgi:hypothetical protein